MGSPILAILEQNRLPIFQATLYPLIRSPIHLKKKKYQKQSGYSKEAVTKQQ